MTMRERIMSGKLFTDECEGMPEERLQAKLRMKAFNESSPDDPQRRAELLRDIFGKDTGSWVEPPLYFCYGRHVNLGQGCYLNMGVTMIDDGIITIGDRVMFGPNVTIATVGHPLNPKLRGLMYTDHVTIGDNVWIGGGVTICPGVTIGENSVIGAGSVVVQDIPANCIAVGNPCKVLRPFDERDEQYYYKDRVIDPEDLAEEMRLRNG